MGAAAGVIAGVNTVGSIASKNSAKRREREQAAAQAYYAQKKYDNEKLALDAQRQFANQQQLIQKLQYEGARIQEDFALKENDLQNLIQAANLRFQNQQQLLASQTQAEQLRAEGDKTKFAASQQSAQIEGQALQESTQASTQMSQELSQLEAAIQKGDFDQAAMIALMAANGQDSSSLSSSAMSRSADAEQAVMGARGSIEGNRLNEQDLLGLVMSREFGAVLERLGIMQGDAQQRQANTNEGYAATLAGANAFNIDREANLSRSTNDAARGILSGQRTIQDLAMSGQGLMNEFQYQQGLGNANLERAGALQGAQMMSNNAKGAGLFDYLNLGYSLYQGATPLFRNSGGGGTNAKTSNTGFNVNSVNGFYGSGITSTESDLARLNARSGINGDFSGTTSLSGLNRYGY